MQAQLEAGLSPTAIDAGLKRAYPTVMREMVRNSWLPEPKLADEKVRGLKEELEEATVWIG